MSTIVFTVDDPHWDLQQGYWNTQARIVNLRVTSGQEWTRSLPLTLLAIATVVAIGIVITLVAQ